MRVASSHATNLGRGLKLASGSAHNLGVNLLYKGMNYEKYALRKVCGKS